MEPTNNPNAGRLNDAQSQRPGRPPYNQHKQTSQLLDEFGATLDDNAAQDIDALKARLREQLATARTALNEAAGSANSYLRGSVDCAIDCTQEYVETKPWQAVGYAAGIAFLLGIIVARR